MNQQVESDYLEEVERIVDSGELGKSPVYTRLLRYLTESSLRGHSPKELEIAVDVLGKGPDFDPSQDSAVRVYVHKLRRRLDDYYALEGRDAPLRLTLPKGEYRVDLVTAESAPSVEEPEEAGERGRTWLYVAAAVVVTAVIFLAGDLVVSHYADAPSSVAAAPIWASMLDDDLPVEVVVGDYYIFAEYSDDGQIHRLVRDFSVNSVEDLDQMLMRDPQLRERFGDVQLTYLPTSSATAIADVLSVLGPAGKQVTVVPMSEFSAADLRSKHIIYIGYVSGLNMLSEFVFASSGLTVGTTYDELIERDSGTSYVSDAGLIPENNADYRDYGLFSTFPGPSGNQIMILAGTRDEGLMHTAHVATDSNDINMLLSLPSLKQRAPAGEALFEVVGMDRTNLDASLVYSSALRPGRIWMDHSAGGGDSIAQESAGG